MRLQARQKAVRHDLPEIPIMLLDRLGAASEKELERLLRTQRDATFGQHVGQAATAQQLTIDQHAVAVEDDQIGFWPALVHPAIRSYTQLMGNSSATGDPPQAMPRQETVAGAPSRLRGVTCADYRRRCTPPR